MAYACILFSRHNGYSLHGISIERYDDSDYGCYHCLYHEFIEGKNISVREHIAKWHIVPRWTFYLTGLMIVVIFGAYGRGYDIVSFIYAQF